MPSVRHETTAYKFFKLNLRVRNLEIDSKKSQKLFLKRIRRDLEV